MPCNCALPTSKPKSKQAPSSALKLWRQAQNDVMGKPKKGEFRKAPKKGSAQYKKIKTRYEALKK